VCLRSRTSSIKGTSANNADSVVAYFVEGLLKRSPADADAATAYATNKRADADAATSYATEADKRSDADAATAYATNSTLKMPLSLMFSHLYKNRSPRESLGNHAITERSMLSKNRGFFFFFFF
jgi:hypothetical protein